LDSDGIDDLTEEVVNLLEHRVQKGDVGFSLDDQGTEARDGSLDLKEILRDFLELRVRRVARELELGSLVGGKVGVESDLSILEESELGLLGNSGIDRHVWDVESEEGERRADPGSSTSVEVERRVSSSNEKIQKS
jgi:hypothetical protein